MLLRSGIQHDRTRSAADRASIMRNAPLLGNVERSDVYALAESAAAPSQRIGRAGCAGCAIFASAKIRNCGDFAIRERV
jgi:hypothetical protein